VTLAHNAVGPNEVWSAWNMSPLVIGALVVAAIAYLRGLRRLGHAGHTLIGHRREAAFYAGLVCAGVALLSPLDALSDTLFSAHMVQHLVLILCAAPLVIYGAPTVPLLLCLPVRFRRPLQRWRHKRAQVLAVLGGPLLVWALHTGAMWAWHQPALYEAGLRDETLHAIEHSSLLVTALLVWGIAIPAPDRALGTGRRSRLCSEQPFRVVPSEPYSRSQPPASIQFTPRARACGGFLSSRINSSPVPSCGYRPARFTSSR
jgi:cytochrome c oxidase assembly factor CtaG